MKMKKPITTAKYFEIICNLLSEKGKMPENILDYKLSTSNAVPMKTYEFSLKNNLDYGSNEDIYLVLWIEVHMNREKQLYSLGTFKTLREDEESMHIMANLLADFLIEEQTYVNEHLDDFTWEGADVHVLLEDDTVSSWRYTCSTMEAAIKRKDIYYNPILKLSSEIMLQEKKRFIGESGMELSSHYKNIRNGKGTDLWMWNGRYLSIGKNGTDIMIKGNGIVVAFDDWNSLINAIDYKKAVYCHQKKIQKVSTDKRC